MIRIPGFVSREQVYETARSVVYRARRERDDAPVVLKVLRQPRPDAGDAARYRHEYEVIRSLDVSGCIRAYELVEHEQRLALVVEDIGATSLSEWIRGFVARRPPLSEVLSVAACVARVLGALHEAGVIHKDINPANIVYNSETGALRIIDFDISTKVSRERLSLSHPSELLGTLPYLSPEQTGRMNRALDYRTDLYSFGVTLYELLTGTLPFDTQDPLALIHAHLARTPAPPHERNEQVPATLSAIVMKLISKNAEERYQSAHGAAADLERCLRDIGSGVPSFVLGEHDTSLRLQIPAHLFGRDEEIARLTLAFERAVADDRSSAPGVATVMLAGGAGIGKTSLARELDKAVTAAHGYIATGKCEELQRNTPYLALRQAFAVLVRYVLSDPPERLERWRSRLLAAFGPNASLMVEVIPDLEWIVGAQPKLPAASPAEQRNRLELTFERMVAVFAEEAPLVLFLDDLHWADSASLDLVERLITRTDHGRLLLVGAYREDALEPGHPLRRVLDRACELGAEVEIIELGPLPPDATARLLAETLRRPADELENLAHVVHHKTHGNPFFVGELLATLQSEGVLFFDTDERRWAWRADRLEAAAFTDNVVELLLTRVRGLPEESQASLRVAAAVGFEFTIEPVAHALGLVPARVFEHLGPAVEAGLVVCTSQADDHLIAHAFRFGHDRVHQAAYAIAPVEERESTHLALARLRRQGVGDADSLFEVVDHYNLAGSLHDERERLDVARMNLTAARRCKVSVAYLPSLRYAKAGIALLPADVWQRDYGLALALHETAAEAAWLATDYDAMNEYVSVILGQARGVLDTVGAYRVKLVTAQALAQQLEAIETGRRIVGQLGIDLPRGATSEDIATAMEETARVLDGRDPLELVGLPHMTDEKLRAAMSILGQVDTSLYQVAPALYVINALRQVQLSVQHGNCPESVAAYSMYAIVLCGVAEQPALAYRFAQLAINLVDEFPEAPKTKAHMIFNTHTGHWNRPLVDSIDPLFRVCEEGQLRGDLEFTAHAANALVWYLLLSGRPLTDIVGDMASLSETTARLGQSVPLAYLNVAYQLALNLSGRADDPLALRGKAYDVVASMPVHERSKDLAALFSVHYAQMYLHLLLSDPRRAREQAALAEQYVGGVAAWVALPPFYFYASLANLRGDPPIDGRTLDLVSRYQAKLELGAKTAPMNFRPKSLLIQAELHRVTGDPQPAADLYDEAIDQFGKHGFLHDQALACELSAGFHVSRGKDIVARAYLAEAHQLYERWGARVKHRALEKQHPWLFSRHRLTPVVEVTTSSGTTSAAIDFEAAMRASRAVSDEIVLSRLLSKLLTLLVELGGAQTGALILKSNPGLRVEATRGPNGEISLSQTELANANVAPSVVNYVARTGKAVILEDAARSGEFTRDPHVLKQGVRSLSCTPIRYQGELMGMIYLENNLTPGAFTAGRVQFLDVLAAQAAVSITNARSYAQLEERVESRTREMQLAKEQAERASRAKSTFLANMSHELRSPLNAILGFAQIIGRRGDLPEDVGDAMAVIMNNADHLLELLNQVLNLSKIEAGRATLETNVFDPRKLMESVKHIFDAQAREKGIALRFDLDPRLPVAIEADEIKLRQVLINLISNAIKFTGRGSVTVRATAQAKLASNVRLHFAVEDTGVGIAPEEQSRLFEAFEQTAAGREARQGTGLGLAITQEFVRLMGGRITVQSVPGVGSTFSFDVEVASPRTVTAREPRISAVVPGRAKRRMMIVDDEWINRHVLSRLLLGLPNAEDVFEIIEAGNGEEALAAWRQHRPDLVWMDIRMPVLGGVEAARRIRALESGSHRTILVAASAVSFEEEIDSLIAAGFDAHLPKPVRREQVFRLLEEHLAVRFLAEREGDSVPALRSALRALPTELLEEIEHAFDSADMSRIGALLGSIAANHPDTARLLKPLVDDFAFDEVVALIRGGER